MVQVIVLITIGIAGGITIGSAFAAFITLLDVIPRLAQLTCSDKFIQLYQKALIISGVSVTLLTFSKITIGINKFFLIPIGIVMGIHIGLLAAALAEVINVIPVLTRRLKLREYIHYVMISLSLGKVVASLIQWIILVKID